MKTLVIYKKLSQKKRKSKWKPNKKDRRPKGEREKADGLENETLIYIFK